jgi:pyruvate/2-oxoglutarate dehydrogenase complex dihydrolipoamide acyltransferase (E2) component
MSEKEILATEGALELAEQLGIDLSEIEGSGDDGKVYKKDVEAVIAEESLSLEEDDLDEGRKAKTVIRTTSSSGDYSGGAFPAYQIDAYLASFLEEGYELVNTHYLGSNEYGYTFAYFLVR